MFYDAGTDQRTLEQIRKAMPAESIDRADADGIFDMLKGYDKSKLHPKKVVVHGKKGNFISTRMVKDDEVTVPQASKPSFNPFDKLDAKLKRDRIDRMNRDEAGRKEDKDKEPQRQKNEPKPETKSKSEAKRKAQAKTKTESKSKPKTESKKKTKPKTETKPKYRTNSKNESIPKPKTKTEPNVEKTTVTTSAQPGPDTYEENGHTVREAFDKLNASYNWDVNDDGTFAWLFGEYEEDTSVADGPVDNDAMYRAYRSTAEEFGNELAQRALAMREGVDVSDIAGRTATELYGKGWLEEGNTMAWLDLSFRKGAVYAELKERFGSIVDDGVLKDAADFTNDTEQFIIQTRGRFRTESEMVRSCLSDYIRSMTDDKVQNAEQINVGHAPEVVMAEYGRRMAMQSARRINKQCGGLLSEDELYELTGAYRPYEDPNPHDCAGSVEYQWQVDREALAITKGGQAILPDLLERPETIEEAAKHANRAYGDFDHKYNCQSCVIAYEARRRGFDVQAGERPTINMYRNAFWGGAAGVASADFRDIDPSMRQEKLERQMAEWGNGARATIEINWYGSSRGHVFIAEQVNGRTVYVEPQTGTTGGKELSICEASHLAIMRIDDKPLTATAASRCTFVPTERS